MKYPALLRLIRFDKPIGTLLLWCPTAWALWLANQGAPSLQLCINFLLGTFFMRSAGCVINDIADRKLDKFVERTQHRPLTTGEVTLQQAYAVLGLLLFLSFIILLRLPRLCFYYALFAVAITTLYPFCKRYIHAPQAVLGVAFSMGIPMAYAASHVSLDHNVYVIALINFAWVIAYDTLYAMVDREDDVKIGIKSTAILFGQWTQPIVAALQLTMQVLWLMLAVLNGLPFFFYIAWGLGSLIFIYQHLLIKQKTTQAYFRAFLLNGHYGFILWMGLL